MQVALTFEESKQRTAVPKQVVGLAAALLAGAAITPMNVQVVQEMTKANTPAQINENIDLSPKATPNKIILEEKADPSTYLTISDMKFMEAEKTIQHMQEKVISEVLSWEGVSYRWGGRARSGVDCSGLVQRVFREQGIVLPRTSYEQFREGVGVPKAKLEPGDLVFFNTNGAGASHVGIYLGHREFISATRHCVEKQSLDNPYWASTYRGSRRILNIDKFLTEA